MSNEYRSVIRAEVLSPGLLRATFSGHTRESAPEWVKVTVRPVEIRGERQLQFTYFDDQRCIAKNFTGQTCEERLDALLTSPFKNINVATSEGELAVTIARSGRPLIHRSKPALPSPPVPPAHNRQKDLLLPEGTPDPYLQAIGFMTSDGRIRAERQRKFRQINEFLRLLEEIGDYRNSGSDTLRIVDCGCGNAYLTFAAYHYLSQTHGRSVTMTGIDVREDLLARHTETAAQLGWTGITFSTGPIAEFVPDAPPDITVALHACDTATDDAIARGIAWNSRVIIAVPCCHHNLQSQIQHPPELFRPVYRHGILGERMGDILTDTFRAHLLRLHGYRTEVVQFVSPEHTDRNLMIRAVRTGAQPPSGLLKEYEDLKQYWKVTPYLETALSVAGA